MTNKIHCYGIMVICKQPNPYVQNTISVLASTFFKILDKQAQTFNLKIPLYFLPSQNHQLDFGIVRNVLACKTGCIKAPWVSVGHVPGFDSWKETLLLVVLLSLC